MMKKRFCITTYNRILWMTVLTLFISVCCTTYVWADLMEGYFIDDSSVMALTPVNLDEQQVMNIHILPESVALNEQENVRKNVARYQQRTGGSISNPGFEASDDKTVWAMNTQIDIFKVSYENADGNITVAGNGADKLIAPGTENSYTFRLKNTGNMPLTYHLTVEAYFSPEDVWIPVNARLNRLDGSWIVGNSEEYVPVEELNGVEDDGALNSGRLATYVLDWVWPFEGSDELDNLLGSRAVDEDLTLTIVINTMAEIETAPNTGDHSALSFWAILSGGSFVMLLLLILFKKKKEEEAEEQNEKV